MSTEFYSVIKRTFDSMIMLLSTVNENIGTSFVDAFKDNRLQNLRLQAHVNL